MKREESLFTARLSFTAKIMATFSHDLKNHLAVIKEHNGLLFDMLELGKMRREHGGQCRESMRSIDRQIDRTLALISSLDGFSRGMQTSGGPCDVNETLGDLFSLTHRLTSQQRVTIEREFSQTVPEVSCSPIDLQYVVFCCIEELMRMVGRNGSIVVTTSSSGETVTVGVRAKNPSISSGEGENSFRSLPLEMVVEDMGATLSPCRERPDITLTIPSYA